MLNPWDVRPPSSRGDSDPTPLFSSVGQALTEWAHVETACAEIFGHFVSAPKRTPYQAPAVRAYGIVSGFFQQCQLLREAGGTYFHKRNHRASLEPRFGPLISECGEYAARRNEIAHGQVANVFVSKYKNGKNAKSVGFFLLPLFYNPKKNKRQNQEVTFQYTSADIIYYRQEFTKLYLRVAAFRSELQGG